MCVFVCMYVCMCDIVLKRITTKVYTLRALSYIKQESVFMRRTTDEVEEGTCIEQEKKSVMYMRKGKKIQQCNQYLMTTTKNKV